MPTDISYKLMTLGLSVLAGVVFVVQIRRRKFHDANDGFEYVYVDENGSVRELDKEEQEYLEEEFSPADGERPYNKWKYEELTPEDKIWGFLPRNKVPKHIEIQKLKSHI